MTHRERLTGMGLVRKIPDEELLRRNEILFRLQQGERIQSTPVWCVFRRDRPHSHVCLNGEDECRDAELIADELYDHEAVDMARKLNREDPEQPMRESPRLPRCGMYAICTMEDWAEWEMRHSQMTMESTAEPGDGEPQAERLKEG